MKMSGTLCVSALAIALLAGCGKPVPTVDIWTAAGTGNTKELERHLAARTDLNVKEPSGGGTPLMRAAFAGHVEAAALLIKSGAQVDAQNNEGSTALLMAAFFGHPEMVKLLLEKGADVKLKNNKGEAALDTVAGAWSPQLEGVYRFIGGLLKVQLDLERIKSARPQIAALLREHGGETSVK